MAGVSALSELVPHTDFHFSSPPGEFLRTRADSWHGRSNSCAILG
jgi:hypothetical protein